MNHGSAGQWTAVSVTLRDELRQLRQRYGFSGRDLAAAHGWAGSKVSRIESGKYRPSTDDVDVWVRSCGGTPDQQTRLRDLLGQAQKEHQLWLARTRGGPDVVQADYSRLVDRSRRVCHFETTWIPGLVQTSEYTRVVLGEMVGRGWLTRDDVDRVVEVRRRRQDLLYDTQRQFEFLVAEPALLWGFVPTQVMRGQLYRLQSLVDVPNIRFGILPLFKQLDAPPENAFQIYDDTVAVESIGGALFYRGDLAQRHVRIYERLWTDAVQGDDARTLIVAAVDNLT